MHNQLTVFLGLVALIRPKQWVKNGFVLAPLVFVGGLLEPVLLLKSVIAFAAFCLFSSLVYIFNDIVDIEDDRKHPTKRHKRPLAAGMINVRQAYVFSVFILAAGLSMVYQLPQIFYAIAGYTVVNLAYSLVLKHKPIWDIFSIATCFVLRVYAGALALQVPLSSWMFVTSFSLALFLAAVKRKQELRANGDLSRKVLKRYSVTLLGRYAEMSALSALMFYSLFVLTTKDELIVTVPLVMFGIFRYWYMVETKNLGESPTDVLYLDWQLALSVLVWVLLCAINI